MFHIRMVLSLLAEAKVRPSGLKHTDDTLSAWPSSVPSIWPMAASQSLMVPPLPPAATVQLSGLKATELTQPGIQRMQQSAPRHIP